MPIVDLNNIKLDEAPQTGQGGTFVDLSQIKMDEPTMGPQDIMGALGGIEPDMPAPPGYRMPTGSEAALFGTSTLPILGAVGGGALGAGTGLFTGGATSIPGAAAGSALGAGIGESARQGINQFFGLEPPMTPKESLGNIAQQGIFGLGSTLIPGGTGVIKPILGSALTMGGAEAVKQGITGEYDSGKVGKSALFGGAIGTVAPIMGKVAESLFGDAAPLGEKPLNQFVEWAKKNKLPFSVDAISGKPGAKAMQMSADYGPGVIISNWGRGKLIDKATQLSKTLTDELGLPPSLGINTTADETALWLQSLRNRNLTHDQYNQAIEALPGDMVIPVPSLKAKLDEIGLGKVGELYPPGKSTKNSPQYNAFQRVMNGDGTITIDDLRFIGDNFWGNKQKSIYGLHEKEGNWGAIKEIGKVKGALMDDMGAVQVPGMGQTLQEVRTAADQVLSDNLEFLRQFPVINKLANAQPGNRTKLFLNLFNEANEPAMQAMRERILANPGGQDMWNALQSSYLDKVFSNSLNTHPKTGQNVFDPNRFLDWFQKYGSSAKKIMPEIAPALDEWRQISMGISKDYKRLIDPRDAMSYGFKAMAGGAAPGFLAGSPVGAVAVPGFSMLASLFTMGPGNWGFIRNSLTKQASQPISMGSRLLTSGPVMGAMEKGK